MKLIILLTIIIYSNLLANKLTVKENEGFQLTLNTINSILKDKDFIKGKVIFKKDKHTKEEKLPWTDNYKQFSLMVNALINTALVTGYPNELIVSVKNKENYQAIYCKYSINEGKGNKLFKCREKVKENSL